MPKIIAALFTAAVVLAGLISIGGPAAADPAHISYLNCSAATAGDGSEHAPWNSTVQASQHDFLPGDRLLVKRGTTCHGHLAPKGSGTAARRIVVDVYGTGRQPTIAGGGTSSWSGAIQLNNQEYWTIRNLRVTNTDGKRVSLSYRSGVLVTNDTDRQLRGITLERLTVTSVVSNMNNVWAGPRSFGGISVLTMGDTTGGFTGLTVRGNTVSHVGRTGIVVSNNSYPAGADHNVRITGNRVEWIRGDGILLTGSKRGRIDHNVSAHAAQEWPCPDCGPITRFTANIAIWTGASDHVRIDHNEAYGTKALGGDGEGFDVDSGSTNAVIEYNFAHDNEGGGVLFCGSTNAIARFNVFENNGKSAIAFIGSAPARDTAIYNNTIFAAKGKDAVNVRTFNGLKGQGIRFFNNLVYNTGRAGWTFRASRTPRPGIQPGRSPAQGAGDRGERIRDVEGVPANRCEHVPPRRRHPAVGDARHLRQADRPEAPAPRRGGLIGLGSRIESANESLRPGRPRRSPHPDPAGGGRCADRRDAHRSTAAGGGPRPRTVDRDARSPGSEVPRDGRLPPLAMEEAALTDSLARTNARTNAQPTNRRAR